MDNDANINAHKNRIDPIVWRKMKASAIEQGVKIHEWLEDAIKRKLEALNEK